MSHLASPPPNRTATASAIAWDRLTPAQEVALAHRLLNAHANHELERFFFLAPLAAKLALPALKLVGKVALKGLGKAALKGLGKTVFKKFGKQMLRRVGKQAFQRLRQQAMQRARAAAQRAAQSARQRATSMGRQAAQTIRQQATDAAQNAFDQDPIEPPIETPDDVNQPDADTDEEFGLRVARQLVRTISDTSRRLSNIPSGARPQAFATQAVLDAVRAQAPDVLRLLQSSVSAR